jgi:hypothetical protein
VVSFTPRPLYPQGKSPWYPLVRRIQRVMEAKLTRLTHKIAIQLHLEAENLPFAVLVPGGQYLLHSIQNGTQL